MATARGSFAIVDMAYTNNGMVQQKNEAERLRLGVRGGWIAIQEAVAWADSQIERTSEPHPVLFELALSHGRSREEVAALLQAVPGSADSIAVMRSCLNDLLEVIERSPSLALDAARWLEAAATRGELPEAHFGSEPYALADAVALAEQGTYGTIEEAASRLTAFLRKYAHREV